MLRSWLVDGVGGIVAFGSHGASYGDQWCEGAIVQGPLGPVFAARNLSASQTTFMLALRETQETGPGTAGRGHLRVGCTVGRRNAGTVLVQRQTPSS